MCFEKHSPTFTTWVPLLATDVFALRTVPGFEGQDIYFCKNHPLRWVRVCGIVVAVDDYKDVRIYTIDDGSGRNIECVVARLPQGQVQTTTAGNGNEKGNMMCVSKPGEQRKRVVTDPMPSNIQEGDEVKVGTALDVKGTIKLFWDERQIRIGRMTILRDLGDEIEVWEKRNDFWETVLSKAWVLDQRTVRKCWHEEERGARREIKRRKRARELRGRADLGDTGEAVGEVGGERDGARQERKKRFAGADLGSPVARAEAADANIIIKGWMKQESGGDLFQRLKTYVAFRSNAEKGLEKRKRRPRRADLGGSSAHDPHPGTEADKVSTKRSNYPKADIGENTRPTNATLKARNKKSRHQLTIGDITSHKEIKQYGVHHSKQRENSWTNQQKCKRGLEDISKIDKDTMSDQSRSQKQALQNNFGLPQELNSSRKQKRPTKVADLGQNDSQDHTGLHLHNLTDQSSEKCVEGRASIKNPANYVELGQELHSDIHQGDQYSERNLAHTTEYCKRLKTGSQLAELGDASNVHLPPTYGVQAHQRKEHKKRPHAADLGEKTPRKRKVPSQEKENHAFSLAVTKKRLQPGMADLGQGSARETSIEKRLGLLATSSRLDFGQSAHLATERKLRFPVADLGGSGTNNFVRTSLTASDRASSAQGNVDYLALAAAADGFADKKRHGKKANLGGNDSTARKPYPNIQLNKYKSSPTTRRSSLKRTGNLGQQDERDKDIYMTSSQGNVTSDNREGRGSRTSRRKAGEGRVADLGQGVVGKGVLSRHSSVTSENNSCDSKKRCAAKWGMKELADLGQPSRWARGGAEQQSEEGGKKNKALLRADLGSRR